MRDPDIADDALPRDLRRKMLLRVLDNLKRAIYDLRACNGILRGNPMYSGPQVFPLAKDALYMQSILRAAKAFDHHPQAASFIKLQSLRPDIVVDVAKAHQFDLARLTEFATKLRKIRNRALAHDDLADLRRDRDVWDEQELSAGEFIACTEFAFAALNEMFNLEFGEKVELLAYDGADAEELARTANQLGLPQKWMKRLF